MADAPFPMYCPFCRKQVDQQDTACAHCAASLRRPAVRGRQPAKRRYIPRLPRLRWLRLALPDVMLMCIIALLPITASVVLFLVQNEPFDSVTLINMTFTSAQCIVAASIMGALLVLSGVVFWMWTLLDCAHNEPDGSRTAWVLIILLLNGVGALAYYCTRRPKRLQQSR